MPRAPRRDKPGSWHHVMNRAIAKRTLLEDRDDFRFLQSLLAREVRRGLIEVHAFSLLNTHFHVLLRSPLGRLATAMRNIQREYARWFNRRRKRDGPLFRSRFRSKPVDSVAYQSILVRYIDDNAISAGLAIHAAAYPYGSARLYAGTAGPPWLERSWVEGEVRSVARNGMYCPRDYATRFPSKLAPALANWVEEHLLRSSTRDGEFAELIRRPEGRVLRWMIRKAQLADGMDPWVLPLPAGLVLDELARLREDGPSPRTWRCLAAGLLRHVCALSLREIRARTGVPSVTTYDRAQHHAERVVADRGYARLVETILDRVQAAINREAFPHRFPVALV